MEDEKKLTAKQFIKQKKLMMKNIKSKQQLDIKLNNFIEAKDSQSFINELIKEDKQTILNYIFSQDELKKTPIIKLLQTKQNKLVTQFLKPICQWSVLNFEWINETIFNKMTQNKLIEKDWQNSWLNLTKQVVKTILSQQEKNMTSLILELFSIQKSIFLQLNKTFLDIQIIKNIISNTKTTEQLQFLLDSYFIPLSHQIKLFYPEQSLTIKLQNYKNYLLKEKIWKSKNYLSQLKKTQFNPDLFLLKQIQFNFIHELMLQKQLMKIKQIYQVLQNSQIDNQMSYLSKIFNKCNQSEQIPSDICLRTWSYGQILKFFQFIQQKQHINLSTNCLNSLLINKNLSQIQIEGLIQKILNQVFFDKGFCKTIRQEQQIPKKYSKKIGPLKTHSTHFFLSFDKNDLLLQKNGKSSYPLLTYLDSFKENCNLKTIESLFIDILERKFLKSKFIGMIKSFGIQKAQLRQGSQGQGIINNIIYYYEPFLKLICSIKHCEVTQYLLSKTYINCHQIKVYKQHQKEQDHHYLNLIGRHFLSIYISLNKDLSENKQNKMIVETIFNSKQSQKFIKDQYNFYYQLIRSLNQTNEFKVSRQWLVLQIKNKLKDYFGKLNIQTLFQTELVSNQNQPSSILLQQMNPNFLKTQQINFNKLKSNYNSQKDWSLFSMPQLIATFNMSNIKDKFVLDQISQQMYNQAKNYQKQKENVNAIKQKESVDATKQKGSVDVTKQKGSLNERIQKCALKILYFKDGYLKPQPQVSLHQLTVVAVKNTYIKQPSIQNLTTYIKIVKQQSQKLAIKALKQQQNQNQQRQSKQSHKLNKFLPYIQISIHQKNIQQKINLILKNNLDFIFFKRNLKEGQQLIKRKKIFQDELFSQGVKKICQRMILKQCSFSTSIWISSKNEINEINNLLQNQEFYGFIGSVISKKFKYQKFQYPNSFEDLFCFYMSAKLKKFANELNMKKGYILQEISNDRLVDQFIGNLQNEIKIINKNSGRKNNKFDEKDQYFCEFMQLWRFGHTLIKSLLNYQAYIKYQPNEQFKCQKSEKQQSDFNQQQDSKQILSSRKPQPQFYHLISRYYENLRKIIKEYHPWKINLSKMLNQLTTQQINNPNQSCFCLYKMQSSQNPFNVFKQWIQIQPNLSTLTTEKTQHKLIINEKKLFLEQLKRMTTKQFIKCIQMLHGKSEQNIIIDMGYILHQIKQQQKIVKLLEHLLVHPQLTTKLNDQYLINLTNQKYLKLTILILFLVQRKQFSFRLEEEFQNNKNKILHCDNISIYTKCNNKTFQLIKITLLQYFTNDFKFIQQPCQEKHIYIIVQSLVDSNNWPRLKYFLSITQIPHHLIKFIVFSSFKNLSAQLQSIKKHKNPQQINQIIQKLFMLFKSHQLKSTQQVFVNAFQLNPQMAFDQISIQSLTLKHYIKCLKTHPKKANLFLKNKVFVSKAQLPQFKEIKKMFPISAYYYEDFQNLDWMIDLFRVQKQILTQIGHQKLMDKKLQTLILLNKMEWNFQQFYNADQINLKCKKILSSNNIESIKKYPKQWFQQYIKSGQCLNLQIMRPSLIMQLIDMKLFKEDDLLKIISTCKMQVLKYFLQKNKIKINLQTLIKIQKNNLKQKSFWEYLTIVDNQKFVLNFIKQFALFQLYPIQEYQQILLKNVCYFKRNLILQYIIQYFSNKNSKKLIFLAGDHGSIKPGIITLPIQDAVQCNYYEYYFLVKSCKNQTPDFYVSSRFLIKTQHEKFSFIPELGRRIQILNILTQILKNGGEMQFKKNIIMKNVFCLKIKDSVETGTIKSQQIEPKNKKQIKKWIYSLQNLIKYVVQMPTNFFVNKDEQSNGIFQKILAVIFNRQINNIPQHQLTSLFPTEMKIINSIKKFMTIQQDSSSFVQTAFSEHEQLLNLLLIYNPKMFLQKYSNYLVSPMRNVDLSLFIKGVQMNITLFEQSQSDILEKYIKGCFFQNLQPYSSIKYSLFLKRNMFLLCLLSFVQGKKKCLSIFQSQIDDLRGKTDLQSLYELSKGINQRSSHSIFEKTTYSNNFDMMVWNNLLKSIDQIQKFKVQNKIKNNQNANHKSIQTQVSQILQKDLMDCYQVQVSLQNISNIFSQIIKQTQKKQIYLAFAYFMNSNRLFCQTQALTASIKRNLVGQNSKKTSFNIKYLQNFNKQINSKNLKSNLIQSQQRLIFNFEVQFSICFIQNRISLVCIQIQKTIQNSKLQILLEKLQKNPKIQELITFSQKQTRLPVFKNFSLREIQNYKLLQSLSQQIPMASNGISSIKSLIEKFQDRISNDKNVKYYSLSDVYGPIKVTQDKKTIQKVLNCMSFYQILEIPKKVVLVKFINKPYNSPNNQQLNDIQQYIRYFTNQITDSHPNANYIFENIIQLSENNERNQILCNSDKFSIGNIVKFYSVFNFYSSELRKLFQNQIDVRYNVLSILNIYKKLYRIQVEKGNKSLIQFVDSFLRNKDNKSLHQNILLMILEDAVNIMKVVRGVLLSFETISDSKKVSHSASYYLNQFIRVDQIQYQISDQILHIKIQIQQNKNTTSSCSLQESNLISRKGFLNSIFSSSQFLTDYFLQPQKINSQCLNISKHLSKKLNTTINVHINYKSLYNFVDYLKNQPNLKTKDIDQYLHNIRQYLLANMEKSLVNQLTSEQCCNRHQVLLLNTFQALRKGSLKQIQKIKSQKVLQLNFKKENQNGLQLISGFGSTVNNFGEFGKNMFLIQIYKSHFTSIVTEGMIFLIGYKTLNRAPQIMKLTNKDDINKVNLIDIAFLLLVSSEIPSNDQLNHQKIIRIFISDLNLNVYKINEQICKFLLNEAPRNQEVQKQNSYSQSAISKNISELIPIVASNIVITFQNQFAKPQNIQKDTKDLKIFSIKLQKISSVNNQQKSKQNQKNKKTSLQTLLHKNKFKIMPFKKQQITLVNYLKRDNQLSLALNHFLSILKNNIPNSDIIVTIEPRQSEQTSGKKIADILQLVLIDLQSSILSFIDQPIRHSTLQSIFSINQKENKDFQNKNVKENVFLQLRKKIFQKYIKLYRIILSNNLNQSKVSIKDGQIIIQISLSSQSKFIKEQDITCNILEYILNKQQQRLKSEKFKLAQFQKINGVSKNYLMKMLDVINIWEMQNQQAMQVLQILNVAQIQMKKTFQFGLSISKTKKSGIYISQQQNKSIVIFHSNIQNTNRQFYCSSQILTFILKNLSLNKTKEMLYQINQDEISFKTLFNPMTKEIQVYNYLSQNQKFEQGTSMHIQYIFLVLSKDKQIFKCKQKVDIQSPLKGVIKNIPKIESLSHNPKYFLIDLKNQICIFNYLYQFPKQEKNLENIICKKSNGSFINKPIYIYCSVQNDSNYVCNDLDLNVCPINIAVKNPLQKDATYMSILRENFNDKILIRKISREVCQIEMTFKSTCHVMINLGTYKNMFNHQIDIYSLTISSNAQLCVQKTKFIQVQFRNKVVQTKEINISDDKQIDKFFKQPPEKISVKSKIKMKEGNQKQIPNLHKQDIQNLVYVVNNESKKYLTRAGEPRIDFIYLCDSDGNPINYKEQFNVIFEHINHLCTIVPQIVRNQINMTKIGLKWTPVIRGHYKVYINNICLNPEYQVGVCAAQADPFNSVVQKPKVLKVCYAQQTQCTFNLRDSYGNIYTELEQSIVGDGIIIQIFSEQMNNYLKKKEEPINKNGIKKIRFSVDNPIGSEQKLINISIAINKEIIAQFPLQISGQALKQRKKNLQKDISAKNKGFYKQIVISRYKFMEDLFSIAQKSLFTNFSVKFSGEQGIDAGGLKRQFYDMIGVQMKNQQNPFFKAVDSRKIQYFINPQILKNKKKNEYFQLFGKYTANSILNSYLIGINFSPVFVKLLYNDPVQFDDLLAVIPEQEGKRYKYLLNADEQIFQDLDLYFTAIVDKRKGIQHELKPEGATIRVDKTNIKEYLDLLTKVLLKDRYQELIQNFIKGFNTVIQLDIIRRWIRPEQFWCLTAGTKQITPQIILNYINFSGTGIQIFNGWFRRFIQQSSKQVLQGFLKFASGSSSIDFDQHSKVTVTWQKTGQNPKKLPISHTCWKQIVIPKYKTYEIMNKLLNAAFIFCSQGFGFG